MAKKKTVLKVNTTSKKDRKEILRAVSKIEGVEKLELDKDKGTLTVVGEVEPVPIFKALKNIPGQAPEIITVGPPKPQVPQQKCGPYCCCSLCVQNYQKQQSGDPPINPCPLPCNRPWCRHCELVALEYPAYDSGTCSIQ